MARNADVPVTTPPHDPSSGRTATPIAVQQGVLSLPGPFRLHHGGLLDSIRVAWRLEGAAGAPVVVALGGISAHRRIFCTTDRRAGWWPELAGPGLPLDATRYRLLGFDYLGGSGETTGPARGQAGFPTISSHDQAAALKALCDALRIDRLHAIAGASYGAMVALAFGELHADRVGHLLVISGAHRASPMATAWRSIQRETVRFGISRGDGPGGLRLARALAMATYRSPQEFQQRFAGRPRLSDHGYRFPVEDYLFARGDEYALQHVPEAFLCLSESIDLHCIEPERVRVPATLVGITEDQLVTIEDMRELEARLAGPKRLYELHSLYGHDAFLKERSRLAPAFAQALAGGQP